MPLSGAHFDICEAAGLTSAYVCPCNACSLDGLVERASKQRDAWLRALGIHPDELTPQEQMAKPEGAACMFYAAPVLAWDTLAGLMDSLAKAVAGIHALGYIHHDIKEANVMVWVDRFDRAHCGLGDFGGAVRAKADFMTGRPHLTRSYL